MVYLGVVGGGARKLWPAVVGAGQVLDSRWMLLRGTPSPGFWSSVCRVGTETELESMVAAKAQELAAKSREATELRKQLSAKLSKAERKYSALLLSQKH